MKGRGRVHRIVLCALPRSVQPGVSSLLSSPLLSSALLSSPLLFSSLLSSPLRSGAAANLSVTTSRLPSSAALHSSSSSAFSSPLRSADSSALYVPLRRLVPFPPTARADSEAPPPSAAVPPSILGAGAGTEFRQQEPQATSMVQVGEGTHLTPECRPRLPATL